MTADPDRPSTPENPLHAPQDAPQPQIGAQDPSSPRDASGGHTANPTAGDTPACPGVETTPNTCTRLCEGCRYHCAAHHEPDDTDVTGTEFDRMMTEGTDVADALDLRQAIAAALEECRVLIPEAQADAVMAVVQPRLDRLVNRAADMEQAVIDLGQHGEYAQQAQGEVRRLTALVGQYADRAIANGQRAERAEAALERITAIPRLPHHSEQAGELGRAYTRGWQSVISAIDAALAGRYVDPQATRYPAVAALDDQPTTEETPDA